MDKIKLTKTIVNALSGLAVGGVVTNIFKAAGPSSDIAPLDFAYKAGTFIAGFSAGSIAANAVSANNDKLIDEVVAAINAKN